LLQYALFPALALVIVWLLVSRFVAVLRGLMKSPEARTVVISAVTLLASGTYVFHVVEGWRPLDALYFCVVSLTTVGYGDLTPKTDAGKVTAIVYIVLGLGIIMAFVTTVAQVAMELAKNRGPLVRAALGRRRQDDGDA